ncbi:torsin-1A [Oryzias melastigma]|uniref:Torsin family 1 n=1 Tax=Oryzias melastigma TaxID=30732 RepID=A0A3B3DI40_ORYME|nr:torsin-1A [Oryzias melastigma]
MRLKRGHVLLLWVLVCPDVMGPIEPITIASAEATTGGSLTRFLPSYKKIVSFFPEYCYPAWISFNKNGLKTDLENKLFGQHLASRIILKAVSGFMSNDNPKKPLVLSLHGSTGTGKNFVSQLIAENIYTEGMNSKFVHVFIATLHFPHSSLISTYKSQLQQWIKSSVSNCERSMFIFDEMEKMHPGLIDSIKPFLDYYDKVDGVSYRKSIFIFLSNAGGSIIVETALDFWRAGRAREEIDLRDIEKALSVSIFNNVNSGFFHTSLIKNNLVDFFVPFLPLEYSHVVQCITAKMKTRANKRKGLLDMDVIDQITTDVLDFPKTEQVFSSKGCKTIDSKLEYYTSNESCGQCLITGSKDSDSQEAKDRE